MLRREESNSIFLFLLLAMLVGWPDRGRSLDLALLWQDHAARGFSAFLAAMLLGAVAWFRREPWPQRVEWVALAVLALGGLGVTVLGATLTGAVASAFGLPIPSWGLALLIGMAAPLWLALLHALGMSAAVVPRAGAGAAMAAVAGACLMVPGQALVVQGAQESFGLLLLFAAAMAMAGAWSFARPRLRPTGTFSLPAGACLLAALLEALLSLTFEVPRWKPVPLTASLFVCLLVDACFFTAGSIVLWFWLFRRMSLAAFGMQSIAAWFVPGLAGFFAFGFSAWRTDLGMVLGIGALYVGLLARPEDDHLTTLGFSQTPAA